MTKAYLERYRKKVGLGASSHKEFTRQEVERNFLMYLQESPTAHLIPMTDPDEVGITDNTKKVLCSINDLSTNDKKAYDEKKVLVPRDCNVDVGCYFLWDNCYWIIIFKEHKSLDTYKKFIARRCNQIFKYKVHGVVYEIPVNVENLTMYSDGLADQKYTSQQDSKRMVTFGSSPVTKTIKAGTRVMLTGKTVFRVTHLNDFEYNGIITGADGIIKVLILQTTLLAKDDLENNIAWNDLSDAPVVTAPLEIEGDKRVMIGSKKTYRIKDMADDFEWSLRGNTEVFSYVVNDDKSLTVQASKNVNHVGDSFTVKVIKKDTKEVIDTKEVQITGFL